MKSETISPCQTPIQGSLWDTSELEIAHRKSRNPPPSWAATGPHPTLGCPKGGRMSRRKHRSRPRRLHDGPVAAAQARQEALRPGHQAGEPVGDRGCSRGRHEPLDWLRRRALNLWQLVPASRAGIAPRRERARLGRQVRADASPGTLTSNAPRRRRTVDVTERGNLPCPPQAGCLPPRAPASPRGAVQRAILTSGWGTSSPPSSPTTTRR